MDALTFFALVPGVFAIIQFFISRSRLPRQAKRAPAVLTLVVGAVCFLGMIGRLPLPETYYFDPNSFLSFPDYWHIGVFCIPALVGLGMGAVIALAMAEVSKPKEKL